jgi:hypothetical protein
MSALPEGRYQGILLASYPSPKHRLHRLPCRLLTGEQIELVMFNGRAHSVALGQARLKFNGYGEPWLPDPDRTIPLPVLNLDLAFDEKYPERNRLLKAHRTGEYLPCDVREAETRKDFIEF